jgi:response regulator NasT
MSPSLQIAVADDDHQTRDFLGLVIPRLGHRLVVQAATGHQLVEQCAVHPPDLMIMDPALADMDGLVAAETIGRARPIPIILVSPIADVDLIDRAESAYVAAYLIKPITQAKLEPAIALATQQFQRLQSLDKELNRLRQAFADDPP